MNDRIRYETDTLRGMAICMMIAMLLSFFISCSGGKKEFVDFEFDSETSYNVKSTDVTMLISDSGITRFRLETKAWYIFDEASEPYYYFPEKVHGERLDTLFQVEAVFDADTAYYYIKKKLMKFINNVKVVNLEGQQFETSLLYYDNAEGRYYSDQFIRITKGDFVNTGTGFEANQTLTEYRIFNSTAEIPIQENTPADSIAVEIPPPL
jgi:LPS export ABC transporter protein LptC